MWLFELWFSQDICLVFLVFKEISILRSTVAVSIYSHTNSARGFPFLHILSSIYCLNIFDDGHSNWREVVPRFSFDLHFSNNEQCWAPVSCVYWPPVCLWRNFSWGPLPIFWLCFLLFWYWAAWAACIFWRLILCQFLYLQLFSAILRVTFLHYTR